MKVPYSWLKEFVKPLPPVEKLAAMLTEQGIEVSHVEQKGKGVSGVVVGQIEHLSRHPNADKLQICRVNVQSRTVSIVTGATNVAVGQKVPVALAGATLASGITIVPKPLRGQLSDGMLCSETELGIGEGVAGIHILPADLPLGSDVGEYFGFGEVVLDMDVLPNRSDCLSVQGIAREVAAGLGRAYRQSPVRVREGKTKVSALAKVRVESKSLCPRYMARVITDVKIAPSPRWMCDRLLASGIRPINNVVDVTNYVLLETGQPLHAFDLDRLRGHQIIIRKSHASEKMKTLDGVERALPDGTLVIADGEHPVAVAGVMGGEESEIQEGTTRILLESAYFEPHAIHRTSKNLALRTESSIRFAAGVSWQGVEVALDRAAGLLAELSAGVVTKGKIDISEKKPKPKTIHLFPERVSEIAGSSFTAASISKSLRSLGFTATSKGKELVVHVPDFRAGDVSDVEDVVEEVVRLEGFLKIPSVCRSFSGTPQKISRIFALRQIVTELMVGSGFQEVKTHSMVNASDVRGMRLSADEVQNLVMLQNPLRPEMGVLRPRLSLSLLAAAAYNIRHQENRLSFFEHGRTYRKESGQVREMDCVAGIVVGEESFYLIKGVLQKFVRVALGWELEPSPLSSNEQYPYLHPGQSATYEKKLSTGIFRVEWGKLHPEVARHFELSGPVTILEIDLSPLGDVPAPVAAFHPLPEYPAAFRDLSFVIPDEISYQTIEKSIRNSAGPLLDRFELFDRYHGAQIPAGHVSLAFRIAYRKPDGTLTDTEVQRVHKNVCDGLRSQCRAQVREA